MNTIRGLDVSTYYVSGTGFLRIFMELCHVSPNFIPRSVIQCMNTPFLDIKLTSTSYSVYLSYYPSCRPFN